MSPQVSYLKWRPQTLTEVVGQEQVTKTLLNALGSGRVSHAYLFCGPRGTGKTSTGRILAKAVNCLTNGKGDPCRTCHMCQAITEGKALDIIEIDAASNRGIDEIRDLRERVKYAPSEARRKVYIIDEVHMLTKEASNALLKTLEEPPPHVIFILATTEAHKVLPTILSRCQRFDFRRISQTDIVSKLSQICATESIKIEPEGLRLIARSATGSLRDAENLLDQLTTYYGAEIGLHQVQAVLGITGDRRAKELVKHIMNNNISEGMATIHSANKDGLDLRQFNREVTEYLRQLLLIKTDSAEAVDLTDEDITELKDLATRAPLPRIIKAVKLFGQLELGFDSYSTLPLELALVDCLLPAELEAKKQPLKTEYQAPPPTITETEDTPEPEPAASEATPAPEESTPNLATPETANEIEQLRNNWRQVIDQAPESVKKANATALLRSSGVKPLKIEGDTVVLAFRYSIHKENMEKPENLRVAEIILSNFLGHPCQVRCIHKPEENHLVKAALQLGAQVIEVEEI